jgi:hypothetical protein
MVKYHARLFFIRAHSTDCKGIAACVLPHGLEGFPHIVRHNAWAQDHIAVDMNFERSLITSHNQPVKRQSL